MIRNSTETLPMNWIVSCLTLLTTVGGIVRADDSTPCAGSHPPSSFSLADVSIECKRTGGWGGQTTITLSGGGTGVKTESGELRDPQSTKFLVEPKELFDLLQLCYRENFFSFLESYAHPEFLRLGVAGKIDTLGTDVFDATSESVTVRIGGYSKSVSWLLGHGNPPGVLSEIYKRAENIASRPVP
jgi:hypothetical protein